MLQLRDSLLRVGQLHRPRLGLECRRVAAAGRGHQHAALVAGSNRRRNNQGGGDDTAAGDRTRLSGRRNHHHLADADHVWILDIVPLRELAVIDAVIERDLRQRLAAFDRV
jgi:hypothetical protein